MSTASIPRTVTIVTHGRLVEWYREIDPGYLPLAVVWGRHERFPVSHPDQIRAALARIQPERLAWITSPGEDAETLRLLKWYSTLDVRHPPEAFEVPERLPWRDRLANAGTRLHIAALRAELRVLRWLVGL